MTLHQDSILQESKTKLCQVTKLRFGLLGFPPGFSIMIISASRRTDIPAFYTPWFMNRIKAGFLLTRNPFNALQIKRVSLCPKEVEAIVFWTRNAEKLIQYLPELDSKEFKYYFQYTITGYPRILEKSVPNQYQAIDTFCQLSERIGSRRVIWRYDPILVSNLVDINEHKQLFSQIATSLKGKTKRVVISFADFYKKTERNLNKVKDLQYRDLISDNKTLLDLAKYMVDIAQTNQMEIQSCAEAIELANIGIEHGKCIDDKLLKEVFDLPLDSKKDKYQRKECGCVKSVDIGQYNTCSHGCSYCYANSNGNIVIKNKQLHDPNSPFLVGGTEDIDMELLKPGKRYLE